MQPCVITACLTSRRKVCVLHATRVITYAGGDSERSVCTVENQKKLWERKGEPGQSVEVVAKYQIIFCLVIE